MKNTWEQSIKPFILKNYKYALAGILVLAVLAFAFWYGAGTSDTKGFTITEPDKELSAISTEALSEESENSEISTEAIAEEIAKASSEISSTEETRLEESEADETDKSVPSGENQTNESVSNADTKPNTEAEAKPSTEGASQAVSVGTEISKPTAASLAETKEMTAAAPATEAVMPKPTEKAKSCTISISCSTILNNMADLAPGKEGLVPADGWILKPVTVTFTDGESVFDVLQRVTREKGIHFEYSYTPLYGSMYIEGINNLYEFDCGSLSGWMYSVNGAYPNYGCSSYVLNDGDTICWVYTCNLGNDVGGGF